MQASPDYSDIHSQNHMESLPVPYAWAHLQAAKRSISQMTKEMPRLREKVEKLLSVDKARAKDLYDDLCQLLDLRC